MDIFIQPTFSSLRSFKGLTGKTSSEGIDAGEGYMKYYEHTNYYPFKDESKEAIDLFVSKAERGYSGPYMDISSTVTVKDPLPFTEREYIDFVTKDKSKSELSRKDKFIEETLNKMDDIKDFWKKRSDIQDSVQNKKTSHSKLKQFISKLFRR